MAQCGLFATGDTTMYEFCVNSDFALISMRGPDAGALLNNISAGAIDDRGPPIATLNGLCTSKGRIVSLFYLIVDDGGYKLIVPALLQEKLIKLINLYRLRADVEIGLDEERSVATMALARAPDDMLTGDVSYPQGAVSQGLVDSARMDSVIVADVGHRKPRSVVIGDYEAVAALARGIGGCTISGNRPAWNLSLVLDAQPWLAEPEQSERYLPQSLDLDHEPYNACSLSKGCYPGQEIVARMHFLGKRKRGLFICIGEGGLETGESLYMKSADGPDKERGTVINASVTAHEDPKRAPEDPKRRFALAELSIIDAPVKGTVFDTQGRQYYCRRCYPEPAAAGEA